MKRFLLPLVMVLAGSSAFAAIDSVKYPGTPDENYEFKSLDSNTSEKEQYLSLYKDGTVLFMRDSKVYTGAIDTTETMIKDIKEVKALTDLGVHGTVAYDEKNQKIYFSLKDEYGNERLYESAIDGESFGKPVKLVVEGFEVVKPDENMYKTKSSSIQMRDDLVLYPYESDIIKYVESDNEDIQVEYKYSKMCICPTITATISFRLA